MEKILQNILEELKNLNNKVGRLEEGQTSLVSEMQAGFECINKKLDSVYAQVAHNTEQEAKLNEVISKVSELETDNKLIKKIITN